MADAARPRRSLVTGGAGFIGSHLVEVLARRGDHVLVIDDLSTGALPNLAGIDPARLTVIEASVTQGLAALGRDRVDEIYHLAAAVGVRLVIDDPIHTIEANVLETSAVLRFAAAIGSPILLASTSEVYGKGAKTPLAEDDDVVYGPTIAPRWAYACSKAIDEYLGLGYHRRHRLPVVIMRFFNTVGPRQVGRHGMVLPRLVTAALDGAPLVVHGDGEQTRCFCDVRDVVTVLPRALADPECAGRVFNVGGDAPLSIAALASLVKRTLDSPSPIVTVPYDQAFGEDFEDLRARQPDLTRIRAALSFAPRIALVQTIRDLAADMSRRAVSRP